MSRNYPFRPSYSQLNFNDVDDEPDAASTIGATSSPQGPDIPELYNLPRVPFLDLGSDDLADQDSDLTYGSNARAAKATDTDRTLAVLEFMKENFPRFSLRALITELFTSDDGSVKNVANKYLAMGGGVHLLEVAIGDKGMADSKIADWIMDQATAICSREASWLTDNASRGDHFEDAKSLRIPAKSLKIGLLQSFSLPGLLSLYERTMPRLQKLLKAVTGKDLPLSASESVVRAQRNPNMGRTLITSIMLNLRSRKTNLHGAMNSLMLWDARVPKQIVQALNRYGFCPSYLYQSKAVGSVSKDGLQLARCTANDPEKLLLLPYDNFNWMQTAWESSATHGSISHDQVSALLVVIALPAGSRPAAQLAAVESFDQTTGTRHLLPPDQALQEILPAAADQHTFSSNATKHVCDILADELEGWGGHRDVFSLISDPFALPDDKKTEEYFLPTFDQEQSSTRGNMLVIDHYFRKVLAMPKESFEDRNFFLLGDRLTTARDRAAQDQRAVDRSEDRIDHLSSFETLSGLMHFVMNMISNIGKNTWGGANKDPVSLLTLLEKLPNRSNINLRKIDFYAWLRFFDVVLRALVLRAAMVLLRVTSPAQLKEQKLSSHVFKILCSRIVAEFLLPSLDRLEAEDVKTIPGSTQSGNAVLLMHDLMTIREMRHAIKHGHPERMERMLKYWTPMFYAGGGYNYANESMELLHNLNHDWPEDISPILRGSMLINNQGKPAKHKEVDIRVEQFNKIIKSHAHGANAQPGLLEKITPAIGHVQDLTTQMFEDLGVHDEDQHHAHVRQHKDVLLLLEHFCTAKIFDFAQDKLSNHTVIDLYRTGLHRLAGPEGGHSKHLRRHALRSRTRHTNEMPPGWDTSQDVIMDETPTLDEEDHEELERLNRELEMDNERPKLTLLEQLDDMIRWEVDYSDDSVELYD
ncbi:hypothetical protein DFH06DRAFT_1087495 [Mycena polygramma]|nr:hypothetical protein DFH06DRAFT_1059074 [Mycena polygramma]KAJ7664518.1 hypothetical protein DFH06DRAFT_1087495 [Mycena polygramma]